MSARTPSETYFLIVVGVMIAMSSLVVLIGLGVTLSLALTLRDPSNAATDWLDVAGGLFLSSIGATAAWLLIKLYRVIGRRGAFEPPHRP